MKLNKIFALALCLFSVISLLTINAVAAAPNTSVVDNDITMVKNVKANDDGTYTITLTSSTASNEISVKSAANIVLVLDASATMQGNNAAKLEEAVNSFLDTVRKAPGSRVAVVGYSSTATQYTGDVSNPSSALIPVEKMVDGKVVYDAENYPVLNPDLAAATAAVETATNNVSNNGKMANTGLAMATAILQDYDAEYKAAHNNSLDGAPPSVVILFTNGIPTDNVLADDVWYNKGNTYKIAQSTIYWSRVLKGDRAQPVSMSDQSFTIYGSISADEVVPNNMRTGCGATVYCIGVDLPEDCGNGGHLLEIYACSAVKVNEFLYRVSSEAPGSSHSETGIGAYDYTDARTRNKDYYHVGDITALSNMFSEIKVETGLTLGEVTIKDVLPPYLELVNPSAYNATTDASGNTTVTWSDKLVAGSPVSKKLTVKFKDGFLGGHSVPTNDTASGIYVKDANNNEVLAAAFGIPTVDVDVPEFDVSGAEKNTYLTVAPTSEELIVGAKITIAGTEYAVADLEAWQTQFVTVRLAANAPDVLNGTTYSISCTVARAEGDEETVNGTGVLNVFKPTLTYPDYTVYLGGNDPEFSPSTTVWTHNGTAAPESMGSAPALTDFAYSKTNNFTVCDTAVTMTEVRIGNASVKDHVTANAFTVHVLKPTVAGTDTHIKLGVEAPMAATSAWNKTCTCDSTERTATGNPPAVSYVYTKTNDSKFPTTCADYEVFAKIGETEYRDIKDTFTIHVHAPVITGKESTIYLGNSTTLNGDDVTLTWNTKCIKDDAEGTPVGNPTPVYSTAEVAPTNCSEYDVALTKIGALALNDCTTKAKVHVLKPTVIGADATIKLGVEAPMGATHAWNKTCTCDSTERTAGGKAQSVSYVFSKNDDNKIPTTCTNYEVSMKIGETEYHDIKDTFTIHVHAPVITGKESTIYLGNSTTLNGDDVTLAWNTKCIRDKTAGTPVGNPTPVYSSADVAPTDCTKFAVALEKIGEVTLSDCTASVQIHVLKPSFLANDRTIYYGTEIDLDGFDSLSGVISDLSWKCANTITTATEGIAPTPVYSFSIGENDSKDAYSPVDCSNLTATWTLAGEDFTDAFIVHVVKPSFTTSDTTIYRGNGTDLNSLVEVSPEWKCDRHSDVVLPYTNIPTISYVFEVDGAEVTSTYAPVNCEEVVTKPTVGNKAWTDLNAFNVHVLQPTFTVTTQNIWADYENIVDLTQYGIASYDLLWKDTTTGHKTPDSLPSNAPTVSSKKYTFDKGTDGQYTVGITNETVNATKLTFTLSNNYGADYALEGKNFTVTVNKFDLTITKAWSGAAVYKQDAIFTVSGGLGDFQVVVPKEESSVIVKGLLCGQKYTVSEDGKWTWRWNKGDNETVICGEKDAEVGGHGITIEAPAHPANAITFTNILNTLKTKWLDFCDVVENVFTKGGSN